MLHYGNNCWMSLFYNNHDNPRMVSKVSMDPQFAERIQILLAAMQLTLKGTPFIFQGDEMGLTNYPFASVEEITDVEVKGYAQELRDKGKTEEEILKTVLAGTREHTRILLPWNTYPEDMRAEMRQPINERITAVYKELIALRKQDKTLIYGDFALLDGKKDKFTYSRTLDGKKYIIDCNLSKDPHVAYKGTEKATPIFVSTGAQKPGAVLQPYEVRIWLEERK